MFNIPYLPSPTTVGDPDSATCAGGFLPWLVLPALCLLISSCVAPLKELHYSTSTAVVELRVAHVDDEARVYLAPAGFPEQRVLTVPLGTDSGWRDLSASLREGTNNLRLEIYNGPYGGWHASFKVRVKGAEVLNESPWSDSGPANGVAWNLACQVIKDGNEYKVLK